MEIIRTVNERKNEWKYEWTAVHIPRIGHDQSNEGKHEWKYERNQNGAKIKFLFQFSFCSVFLLFNCSELFF
jgi:hypothetical protein